MLSRAKLTPLHAIAATCFLCIGLLITHPAQAQNPTNIQTPTEVSLGNLPETVEVKALVDYISQRLGVNILYNENDLADHSITLKAPTPIPADRMLALVENILKLKGLALVQSDTADVMRIVPFAELTKGVPVLVGQESQSQITTEMFELRFADLNLVLEKIKPLLANGDAGVVTLEDQNLIIVTDYAPNIERAKRLVALMDRARPTTTSIVKLNNATATEAARQLNELMLARQQTNPSPNTTPADEDNSPTGLKILADSRTNKLYLVGLLDRVEEALGLIADLDEPVTSELNPVQIYPLANTTSEDILDTLQRLAGESGAIKAPNSTSNLSDNLPANSSLAPPTTPNMSATGTRNLNTPSNPTTPSANSTPFTGVSVTADPHLNSIIVIADPPTQKIYAQLIEQLDKRRPQVLVEVKIITIDTTDGFSLGVDLATNGGDTTDPHTINFSSFGISAPNTSTGELALGSDLATGFTSAILGPSSIDIVINALQSNDRVHVHSAPNILVNDNAQGEISAVTQEPYETNIVSSDTLGQSGFGGYEEAGTIVQVTPHISENDYLKLEYQVELSSFIGDGTSSLPPARNTAKLNSDVTIPDNSTIIVGGINAEQVVENIKRVPILGQIPYLEYLFSNRSEKTTQRTFFVFIRPRIFRKEGFDDLRHVSGQQRIKAELPDDYPTSQPLRMR